MMKPTLRLWAAALVVVLSTSATTAQTPQAFIRPPEIVWGATVAQTQAALAGKCTTLTTRPINPPFAPDVRRQQLQIDCDGFDFMGGDRWAEFVFRDDSLEMVWIMVRPEDREPMIAAITRVYGAPTATNEKYVAFPQGDTAWRHQPAEVLFYSPAFEAWAEKWFD